MVGALVVPVAMRVLAGRPVAGRATARRSSSTSRDRRLTVVAAAVVAAGIRKAAIRKDTTDTRAKARRPKLRRVGRTRARRGRLRLWLWPGPQLRKRTWRAVRRAPGILQGLIALIAMAVAALAVNGVYQVLRKPTELFFPVSGALNKMPEETWRRYAPVFREHSTDVTTAPFLAALAQVEASGNPIARTYWRWSWKPHFFELYRPASSAVGMYQITDGTFAEARHLCVHDHRVVREGPWNDWHACWMNALYSRVVPSNAVELVSAYLTANTNDLLTRYHRDRASELQRQQVATVIHLCGAGAAAGFVRQGLHVAAGAHCGDQSVASYLSRVATMTRLFSRLDAVDPQSSPVCPVNGCGSGWP
jgi:hypothetical protein